MNDTPQSIKAYISGNALLGKININDTFVVFPPITQDTIPKINEIIPQIRPAFTLICLISCVTQSK